MLTLVVELLCTRNLAVPACSNHKVVLHHTSAFADDSCYMPKSGINYQNTR